MRPNGFYRSNAPQAKALRLRKPRRCRERQIPFPPTAGCAQCEKLMPATAAKRRIPIATSSAFSVTRLPWHCWPTVVAAAGWLSSNSILHANRRCSPSCPFPTAGKNWLSHACAWRRRYHKRRRLFGHRRSTDERPNNFLLLSVPHLWLKSLLSLVGDARWRTPFCRSNMLIIIRH